MIFKLSSAPYQHITSPRSRVLVVSTKKFVRFVMMIFSLVRALYVSANETKYEEAVCDNFTL